MFTCSNIRIFHIFHNICKYFAFPLFKLLFSTIKVVCCRTCFRRHDVLIFQVDENMKRAQKRDALQQEVFYFRKDITTNVSPPAATSCCQATDCSDVYITMTIDQIINGKVCHAAFIMKYLLRLPHKNSSQKSHNIKIV